MIGSTGRFFQRLYSFFRRTRLDSELDSEMAAHLELATEENLRRKMTPDEARRQSLIQLGGVEQVRERHREARGLPSLETLVKDLHFAFRGMHRDVGTTVLAILIAGGGIGSASTVFSVVNALLLRPLPFRDPGRLVWISNGENYSTQAEQYSDLRDQNSHSPIWRAGPGSTARATRN